MSEYEYRCPHCQGDDISFLRLQIKEKKIDFWCNLCEIEFQVDDQEVESGVYRRSEILALGEKYPRNEKRKCRSP